MKNKSITYLLMIFILGSWQLCAQGVSIIAAENFYGEVASLVAGSSAKVTSIMKNPNQDPHEFPSSDSLLRVSFM